MKRRKEKRAALTGSIPRILEIAIVEPEREIPIKGEYDVVVCGAGPAGVTAAIEAGRSGAKTLLIESQGCLGGVWTSGLLCWILDGQEKVGLIREIYTDPFLPKN